MRRGFGLAYPRSPMEIRSIEIVDSGESARAVRLPLHGTIAAGSPLDAVANDDRIDVPAALVKDTETSYVLEVRGDLMIEEQIRDGDFVVVERNSRADNGDTVVALIDGAEATLKRFYREGDRVRLQPANASLQPYIVDAKRVEVQGVVVGLIRRY